MSFWVTKMKQQYYVKARPKFLFYGTNQCVKNIEFIVNTWENVSPSDVVRSKESFCSIFDVATRA